MCRSQQFQPRAFVRREDAVWRASRAQHFVALKDNVVFAGVKVNTDCTQRMTHANVAAQRSRFVVVIRVHGLSVQRVGQTRNFVLCKSVKHDQAHAVIAALLTALGKCGIQFVQTGVDELDAPVRDKTACEQRIENVPVEQENAPHAAGSEQRVVQCCVIFAAKITSKPDERTID